MYCYACSMWDCMCVEPLLIAPVGMVSMVDPFLAAEVVATEMIVDAAVDMFDGGSDGGAGYDGGADFGGGW